MAYPVSLSAYEIQLRPGGIDRGFTLSHNSLELITTQYVAWSHNWGWAGARIQHQDTAPGALQTFDIEMRRLGVEGQGTVVESSTDTLVWTYDLNFTEDHAGVIGGGLRFNLNLTSEGREGHRAEPEILQDNTGFIWEIAPGKTSRLRFEPAPLSIFFEQGNRNQLRAFFVPSDLEAGTSKKVSMTVELPKGTRIAQSLAERYGPADTENWYRNALDPHLPYIDLSYLNEPHTPAGRHGFLKQDGDRLVFDDGTEARFWGTNLQAYTLFINNKARIRQHAKRLAALGYNLVRLHHHDSATWVRNSLIADGPTSQQLNEEALDSYHYWIYCLKEEGIHIWLDLHVGRPWREGDEIPGWADLADKVREDRGASTKGYFYYNQRLTELMRKFYSDLLNSANPYTGLQLKNEPAIAFMLLVNENDLTHHFGNNFLPDKGNAWHHRKFWEATAEWAGAKQVDVNEVHRTWLPGLSKVYLNDRQHEWAAEMLRYLREDLGITVPIATDHMWGGTPWSSLPALTAGDLIDVHMYDGGEWLNNNPRFKGSFFSYIAGSQLSGYPLTITEYNFSDGASGLDPWSVPLMVAVQGAFQGWDGPMLYGYSQDGLRGDSTSMWSSYTHPGVVGLSPACALLYRQQHVQPARQTALLKLDEETLFHTRNDPNGFRALRTLAEQHRIAIALPESDLLPWLEATTYKEADVRLVEDLREDFIPTGQPFVESDTGEIRRDWVKGIVTVDTPKSQGAMGWIGGETVKLGDITLNIDTPKAAVFLTSLDEQPLAESARILISTAARVAKSRDGYLSEPVTGTLTLPGGFNCVPLMADGSTGTPLALTGDGRALQLPADVGTHWFLLTRE
ncbi:MAG: hypothetical protein ACFBZ8_08255 [Opitutales bacterium]